MADVTGICLSGGRDAGDGERMILFRGSIRHQRYPAGTCEWLLTENRCNAPENRLQQLFCDSFAKKCETHFTRHCEERSDAATQNRR